MNGYEALEILLNHVECFDEELKTKCENIIKKDLEILDIYVNIFTPDTISIDKKEAYFRFNGTDHEEFIYNRLEILKLKKLKEWLENE